MTDPDTTAVRADHERIWLEPRTPDDCYGSDGRTWCQDNVWPEHEGQPEPTEYVRADIAASELATLRESLAKAEEARSTWHRLAIDMSTERDDAWREADKRLTTIAMLNSDAAAWSDKAAALKSQVERLAGALIEARTELEQYLSLIHI